MNNEELKSNLLSPTHWIRLAFMVLFAIILYVVSFIMSVVVAIQFVISLITGKNNVNLRRFGHSLSTYIYQTLQFLTYNSEEKPFPFADWPEAPEIESEVIEVSVVEVEIVEETSEPAAKKARTKKPAKTDDTVADNGETGTVEDTKGKDA